MRNANNKQIAILRDVVNRINGVGRLPYIKYVDLTISDNIRKIQELEKKAYDLLHDIMRKI